MDEIKDVAESNESLPNIGRASGASIPVKGTYYGPETEQEASNECVEHFNNMSLKVGDIDTAAPFESVKEAVSRFGRVVSWKAHDFKTAEKRVYMEQQHEEPSDEIMLMKKKCEAVEEAQLQKELVSTKRLIEELKLKLERVQTKEHEAKQEYELVKLRLEEMEQGTADRHAAAVAELESVRKELENLRKDFDLVVSEKDIAVNRAQEATSSLKDVERQVKNLTIQLVMEKESLESTHAAHLEAEKHKIGAVMERKQDALIWKQELEQEQEELEKTNQQIKLIENKKCKLETARALLHNMRNELAVYKEYRLTRNNAQNGIQAATKNVEDVKRNITKATEEIDYLKTTVSLLEIELNRENTAVAVIRQREGMAQVVVSSLEAELKRTISEIALLHSKEMEAREKLIELPGRLQKAAQEADQAKSRAQEAREELKKAKDSIEQAKAGANTMESRLVSAQKEIEAAKGLQKLALAVIDALHRRENEPKTSVTLSLEEYYELSKKAKEAAEGTNTRVAEAMSLIDEAKESESKRLSKLEQMTLELAARKQAFDAALQKVEKAEELKLVAEQDLRKWRAEHGHRRKSGLHVGSREGFEEEKSFSVRPIISPLRQNSRIVLKTDLPESNSNTAAASPAVRSLTKTKGSVLPRIFMDLRKNKT